MIRIFCIKFIMWTIKEKKSLIILYYELLLLYIIIEYILYIRWNWNLRLKMWQGILVKIKR